MRQSVTFYTTETVDKTGSTSWSGANTVKARVEPTHKRIFNERGSEVQAELFAAIDSEIDTPPSQGNKMVYNSKEYRIEAIEPIIAGNGNIHHYEIYLTRWR